MFCVHGSMVKVKIDTIFVMHVLVSIGWSKKLSTTELLINLPWANFNIVFFLLYIVIVRGK